MREMVFISQIQGLTVDALGHFGLRSSELDDFNARRRWTAAPSLGQCPPGEGTPGMGRAVARRDAGERGREGGDRCVGRGLWLSNL